MGKPTGFLEFERTSFGHAPVKERIQHYNEFAQPLSDEGIREQAARCMDCGVPFCHSHYGCPLGNIIPQFNDQLYRGHWDNAYRTLISTNNFPEFTGRVCPAPCESACVLGINEPPVTIEQIEYSLVEKAFSEGKIKPQPPKERTGKSVGIVGSGPAGLATAAQLNKAGHQVTVYEKDARIGGLLRSGIPNFKLDKQQVVQRRIDLMAEEGIEFITRAHVGVDISAKELQQKHDALVFCGGAGQPRDLPIPNREASGIHFAMEFLSQNNARVEGDTFSPKEAILATGKQVVVIGGGDTGSDCVGTSIRQGAANVTQIELLPKPPLERDDTMPWPTYPRIFRTSSSQEEGCTREFSVLSRGFLTGEQGQLTGIDCIRITWEGREFKEIPGSEFILKADLVLLAMGFLGPVQNDVIRELDLETDARSNVQTTRHQTNIPGLFCAGDMRRGQSLVVWAIHEGRECAREVDTWLKGAASRLNAKDHSFYEPM